MAVLTYLLIIPMYLNIAIYPLPNLVLNTMHVFLEMDQDKVDLD